MESEEYAEEQAHARVRSRVLSELGLRTEGGDETVLLQVSGETYAYNRVGEWQISSMATEAGRDGEAVTDVAIGQPLAALPPASLRSCAAQLPYPEQILPEAFEEHPAIKEGDEWMQHGLSAEDLRRFCISEGHPFFFAPPAACC